MKRYLVFLCLFALSCPSAYAKLPDPGDLNFDGKTTLEDVRTALEIAVGNREAGITDIEAADLVPSTGIGPNAGRRYGDGRITLSDVVFHLRAVIGLEQLVTNWHSSSLNWGATMGLPENTQPGGGSALLHYSWEGPGEVPWSLSPEGAGVLWETIYPRNVLLSTSPVDQDVPLTVVAGTPPFHASKTTTLLAGDPPTTVDLRVATEKKDHPPLEPVQITVTAQNNRESPLTLSGGVILMAFDNETRKQVWEARAPNWDQKVELRPNGLQQWNFTWDWRDLQGAFVQPRDFTLFAQFVWGEAVSKPVEVTRVAVN